MLSPFYYSGFVRMYAKFLNMDPSEVIEDYKQEELPEHIDSEIEDDFQMPKWVSTVFTRQRKQQIVIGVGAFIALYVFVQIIGFIFSREPKPKIPRS